MSVIMRGETMRADILALKHVSSIFGHCNFLHFLHFLFLISKPVFEHGTGGDATPTNRTERQCWVVTMSKNSTDVL